MNKWHIKMHIKRQTDGRVRNHGVKLGDVEFAILLKIILTKE